MLAELLTNGTSRAVFRGAAPEAESVGQAQQGESADRRSDGRHQLCQDPGWRKICEVLAELLKEARKAAEQYDAKAIPGHAPR